MSLCNLAVYQQRLHRVVPLLPVFTLEVEHDLRPVIPVVTGSQEKPDGIPQAPKNKLAFENIGIDKKAERPINIIKAIKD